MPCSAGWSSEPSAAHSQNGGCFRRGPPHGPLTPWLSARASGPNADTLFHPSSFRVDPGWEKASPNCTLDGSPASYRRCNLSAMRMDGPRQSHLSPRFLFRFGLSLSSWAFFIHVLTSDVESICRRRNRSPLTFESVSLEPASFPFSIDGLVKSN